MGNGFRCPFFLSIHLLNMNTRVVLAIILVLLSVCDSYSQQVEINVTLRNEKGAYATVLMGFDVKATLGIDKDLGEFAIPGFPPTPAGLQAALIYRDNGQAVLAYRDFRPIPSTFPSRDTFTLTTTPATDDSRGAMLIFTWAYPLRKGIDSVVISDLFGGILYRVKFDSREADTVRGNAMNLENFRIVVYSSQIQTDVRDMVTEGNTNANTSLLISPGTPVSLVSDQFIDDVMVTLTNLEGVETVLEPTNDVVRFPNVAPGLYTLRVVSRTTLQCLSRRLVLNCP